MMATTPSALLALLFFLASPYGVAGALFGLSAKDYGVSALLAHICTGA
jgi:hypothetical protein